MIRLCSLAAAAALVSSLALVSQANERFTNQLTPASGTFEWGVGFTGSYSTVRSPNAGSFGGTATLAPGVVPPPSFAPPAQVFASLLYTGSSKGRFTTALTGASTVDLNSTVVLQLAYDGGGSDLTPATIALNGAAPTELVDRGVGVDALHYYWAEWQTGAAASYTLTFDTNPHFALAGAQLDYYNGASVFNATAGHLVPEPATVVTAGLGFAGMALAVGRRRRNRV